MSHSVKHVRGPMAISSRIILVRNDKVLLGLRQNTSYANGKWMLPGGSTEKNETAMQSVIREASEELSVIVKPDNLEFVGVVHWYKASQDTDGATFNWACREWDYARGGIIEPENLEQDKCARLEWFSKEQVKSAADDIESTSMAILQEFFNNKTGSYVECDWPQV